MKINISKAMEDGFLGAKYSNGASDEDRIIVVPYVNFPFQIEQLQKEYKYLSWNFIDYNYAKEGGTVWVHWLVANYETDQGLEIPEKLVDSGRKYVGGTNSFISKPASLKNQKLIQNYGGPMAPNGDNYYTFYVYAHNQPLDVRQGFYISDLEFALDKVKHETAKTQILCKHYSYKNLVPKLLWGKVVDKFNK